jgi:glycosyltransferase involved in cell wall biosynthesis
MKINLVLSMSPTEGGKFDYSLSILNALVNNDKDLVITYYDSLWEEYIPKGIKRIKLEKENKYVLAVIGILKFLPYLLQIIRSTSKYYLKISKALNNDSSSLIIYAGGDSLSYLINKKFAIPVFDLMHIYEDFPEVRSKKIFFQRNFHYKNVVKYAKLIFVDSLLGKEQLIQNFKFERGEEKKIKILPYVSIEFNFKEKFDLTLENGFNLNKKYIFYPAQFWKHKNHKVLLQALSLINNKQDEFSLVLTGAKKNNLLEINQLITKLNLGKQVYIFGYIKKEEIFKLYKKAFCLIMPTYFGPTNIPQLEAAKLGCPVILSDVYAHREQMGNAAIFFNPNSKDDLVEKIKLLKKDNLLRKSLIKNGQKLSKAKDFNFFMKTLDSHLNQYYKPINN